ncbi:hypothetical protein K503DRAFT_441468 [Rhizopogon vinicolor AM-OR11-026]|uniref:Vps72/YL1 C-terminal domain-containing protein n=1 Tax=Rhizopogon vinicolor AM-OR11-026 TaxID=1314800 RepID=A0A1B7NAG0_9AGAM|nr:hypothetical protein K503DRAFT_441468 [Rhizopogon vinicolor AM-OR11-026]
MPPKGTTKKKAANDGSTTHTPTLAEQLSYLQSPRPFKNPNYTKNVNRRTKNLKTVLGQERERERVERERRRQERDSQAMDVDDAQKELVETTEDIPTYLSIEAPPSVLPQRHYCDITGLEAPYTDPRTGLRYHDKSVYEVIKNLSERSEGLFGCKGSKSHRPVARHDSVLEFTIFSKRDSQLLTTATHTFDGGLSEFYIMIILLARSYV